MPDLSWILYDTAQFGTTANTSHELFQVAQGADSTHSEDFTNSPGSGSLPSGQKFVVEAISVYPEHDIGQEEIAKVFNKSWLELKVSERVMLKAPLSYLAAPQQFTGHYSQGTAADGENVSWSGPLFELGIPIVIPGGTQYKVTVMQIVATAATEQVKILLHGTLTRP